MINLKKEKEYKISTSDVYDIVSYAVDTANNGGFINDFLLERVLYEYAVLTVYADKRDDYQNIVNNAPLMAWDKMLKDGILDTLVDDYSDDLEHIATVAKSFAEDYERYAQSTTGALSVLQTTMGNISDYALNNLQKAASNEVLNEVEGIADKWGKNNKPLDMTKEQKLHLVDEENKEDSLFDADK